MKVGATKINHLIEEYLNEIRTYLKSIINDLAKNIIHEKLTIVFHYMISKDNDEGRVVHSRSDNIELTVNDKEDYIIEEFSQSLLSRYEIG